MAQVATKQKEKAEEIINSVLNKEDANKDIHQEIIQEEPTKLVARVLRLARNPKFVYGVLDGLQIEIYLPRNREKSVGKVITVVKADDIGENRYRVVTESI
jgi:hypothetical protein